MPRGARSSGRQGSARAPAARRASGTSAGSSSRSAALRSRSTMCRATSSGSRTARRKNGLAAPSAAGSPRSRRSPGSPCGTRIPRVRSAADVARENASCACFDAEYGPAGRERDRPRDRDDVHDVRRARGLEPGQERAQAPDAAEVVRPDDAARCAPGRRRGTSRAPGMPALFTSSFSAGCRSRTRDAARVDGRAVGDVADLVLAVDLAPRARAAGPRAARAARTASRARASSRASAAPMPLDAPVRTATSASTRHAARDVRAAVAASRRVAVTVARRAVLALLRLLRLPGRANARPRGCPPSFEREPLRVCRRRRRRSSASSSSRRRRARRVVARQARVAARRRATSRSACRRRRSRAAVARVRQDVRADRVDVLRLLVVGGDQHERLLLRGGDRRRVRREREEHEAA